MALRVFAPFFSQAAYSRACVEGTLAPALHAPAPKERLHWLPGLLCLGHPAGADRTTRRQRVRQLALHAPKAHLLFSALLRPSPPEAPLLFSALLKPSPPGAPLLFSAYLRPSPPEAQLSLSTSLRPMPMLLQQGRWQLRATRTALRKHALAHTRTHIHAHSSTSFACLYTLAHRAPAARILHRTGHLRFCIFPYWLHLSPRRPLPHLRQCTHVFAPLPACTHLFAPLPACTHLFAPLPACTHLLTLLPACTHLFAPLPACTHLLTLLPACTSTLTHACVCRSKCIQELPRTTSGHANVAQLHTVALAHTHACMHTGAHTHTYMPGPAPAPSNCPG